MNKRSGKPKYNKADFQDAEILDLSPADLPDELWADVPLFDGLLKVSSKGRLKRIKREVTDSRGFTYLLEDKIVKLKLHYFFNKHVGQYTCHPTGRIQIENKTCYFAVSRMVYYCFVEPFDLNDKSILIIARDHNGLNMGPGNLMKVTYAGFQEHISNSKRRAPDFWMHNGQGRPFYELGQQSHNIEVSRYDLRGKLLATYPSIAVAAKTLNVSDSSITRVIAKRGLTGHGFIWRRGKTPTIRVTKAMKMLLEKSGPVSQYSIEGIKIVTFDNVAAAAKSIGISARNISDACKSQRRICAGFQWRYGNARQLTQVGDA